MIYLQGTIGYTILKNMKTNKKIIIFADMHDELPLCKFNNSVDISKWLSVKMKNVVILLEEVVRSKDIELLSLWNSKHTNELKNLFLNNQKKIIAIDIRPYLISFSWELIESSDNKEILLNDYLKNLNDFLELKNHFIKDKLYVIKHIIKKHLLRIKINYQKFLNDNRNELDKTILYIYKNNRNILEKLNKILDDCMEWYICVLIKINEYSNTIVHAGLYHTEKVILYLKKYYKYKDIKIEGINKINNINNEVYSCQPIDSNII